MAMRLATRTLSRAFDAAVATILLLLASPVMILIAVAIKCDSQGPVIFAQPRLGRGGKVFAMRKFRSLQDGRGASGTVVPRGDPRITRVGQWLRRCRLDELPQLFDVLLGRMALVGPRPEMAVNLEAVAPDERERLLSVRPGLTGPIQLEFIAEDEVLAEVADPIATYRKVLVPAKVRRDLTWLADRSFHGDLWVLLRTPGVLLSARAWAVSRAVVERVIGANG